MKNKIVQILKKHPKGLKAREIAELIPGMDKKEVNSILYSNPQSFVATDYVWTLKTTPSSSKSVKAAVTSIEKEYFFKWLDIKFGTYTYYRISYKIEKKIEKLSSRQIQECISNLEALLSDPIIKKNNFSDGELDYVVNLSMLSRQEIANRISRVQNFELVTFADWRTVAEMPISKYNMLLTYKLKLKEIKAPICCLSIPTWKLLLHLLDNNDFDIIKKHNDLLCSRIKFSRTTFLRGEEWFKIVTLPDNKFLSSLDNIKRFIEDDEKYHFIKFHVSISDIIPFCHLPANMFHQRVDETYKNMLVEELQKNKHNISTKSISKEPSGGQVLVIARKCTGNCSTCNRENCPER